MMSGIIEGYNYDIFISYRQKDNKGDRWVSRFVEALANELEATFKEDISIYFDENPHDRLQETHDVDKSLEGKLKCLIFIPILSQTYCDPNSYAWKYELQAFNKLSREDRFGRDIRLKSGNVASRILPVRIHDLEPEDIKLFESETGSVLRALDFVFKTSSGVNRPLKANEDHPQDNLNKIFFSDQMNKVAHAIKEIVNGMKAEITTMPKEKSDAGIPCDGEVMRGERSEVNKPVAATRGKLFSTLFILSGAIIVGILLFPKLFKRDKFEKIRDGDGRISIAVMPFENLTGDTTLNWFQRGISSLFINALGSSPELAVRDDQTMFEVIESMDQVFTAGITPSQGKMVAQKAKAETYLSGSFQGIGGIYWILIKLIDTESGEIIWTNKSVGDLKSSGYLSMVDSLCNELKNYLEIRVLEQKADYDFREVFPESAEAYRYFIEGMNLFLSSEYEPAVRSLKKALRIDSTFTFATFYIAFAYDYSGKDQERKQTSLWTQRAYNFKDRLPTKYQNWLELWYACFVSENLHDIIQYCNLLEKNEIESRLFWFDLGTTYRFMSQQYDKAVEAFGRIEEINLERGSDWKYDNYYSHYCEALLLANRPEEAKRISEKGLNINPNNKLLIIYQGSSNVMRKDIVAANEIISKISHEVKSLNLPESTEEFAIGSMYLWAKDTIIAEKHFRKAYNLDPENIERIINLAWLLIRSGINIEEGLELSDKGLNKYPDNINLLWMKGLALYKSGKYDEGLAILKEADKRYMGYLKDFKDDINNAQQAVAGNKTN